MSNTHQNSSFKTTPNVTNVKQNTCANNSTCNNSWCNTDYLFIIILIHYV